MSAVLNRKKSFGTVYGHPQIGYEQEGEVFKHDGTLHIPDPPKPVAEAPDVLKAIEGLSSQVKDLKEPKGPDPARSEAARKIWAERRARESSDADPDSTAP